MDSAYERAAFSCGVGQVVKAECADGVYFICREPLNANALTEELKEELMLRLTEESLTKFYETAEKTVEKNQEILNLYSFSQAKYFTNFQ